MNNKKLTVNWLYYTTALKKRNFPFLHKSSNKVSYHCKTLQLLNNIFVS